MRAQHPRLGEHDRVFDRSFDSDGASTASPSLHNMFLVTMDRGKFVGTPGISAQPGFVVQPNCVYDEGIAFPVADRMAKVGGVEVLRVLPSIGIDQAVVRTGSGFVEHGYRFGRRNNKT